MYTITYQTENYNQWTESIIFTNHSKAVDYLLNKDFIKDGYTFTKVKTNWGGETIAYVILCEVK